ncbi:transcription elongation factor Spt6 [Babesia gibsoni]|uniref:Transcription elongation factor Spt6 n=1 Tax=Babesia gibsoni TaxID=33632 RepID=A0AAD8PGD2_BABGI|nr:transcription elongation factor Spt6 [Babesia gibsoni]
MTDATEVEATASPIKRKRLERREDELKEERRAALKAAFGERSPKSNTKSKHNSAIDDKENREKYLDTMAEESEDEDGVAYREKESDEEDDVELGAEIPEEMKGFIVDKVDDDEGGEESDVSDVEYDPDVLDDDDLALIAENTGKKFTQEEDDDEPDRKQLRRLKKGKAVARAMDEMDNWLDDEYLDRGDSDLTDIWATVAECFGDISLVQQILKNEHPTQQQLEGEESDYEPEYTEPPVQDEVTLEALADPDELAKEYMTKQDEEIRIQDQPERLYIRYRNRPRHTDITDIKEESIWIARRLMADFPEDLSTESVKKMYETVFRGTFPFPNVPTENDLSEKCEMVLSWLLNERWEVPFILYHKRHLICPPLTDDMVWCVYHLDAEWYKLKQMAVRVKQSMDIVGHDQLPNDLLYYATNYNTIEDLNDVNAHLRYHHRKLLYEESGGEEADLDKTPQALESEPAKALEDLQESETDNEEDDVFGELAFGNNDLEAMVDPQHFKSPSTEILRSPLSAISAPRDPLDDDSMVAGDVEHSAKLIPPKLHAQSVPDDDEEEDDMDMEVDGNQRTDHAPKRGGELLEMDEAELEDDYYDDADVVEKHTQDSSQALRLPDTPTSRGRGKTKKRNVDMYVIDSIEKGGFHEYWQGYIADTKQFATVLEKSLIPGSNVLKVQMDQVRAQWKEMGVVGILDAPSIIEGSEEQQVEDICAQYCAPPYNSGKRLYLALVNYYTKLLANNITIRRILREYYRNYCCITCTTTTKGEAEVDPADPTWVARRLYRIPLRDFITYGQVYYPYPKRERTREGRLRVIESHLKDTVLPELYLQIVKLEREGIIKCTVHPVCAKEVPPWREDDFGDRFAEWYERYKVVTYSSNQVVSESYRTRMGEQKAILEKEDMLLKEADDFDRQWRTNLLDQLAMAYCPSNVPTYSIWRYIQKDILSRLINVELIPKFRMEIREELWRNAQTWVLLHCQRMLQYKLDIAPNANETVLALAVEEPSQRVYAVVVNESGDLKEYKRLDYLVANQLPQKTTNEVNPLLKEVQQDVAHIVDFISHFRIKVVLVAMCNLGAVTLCQRLESYLLPIMTNGLVLKKMEVEVPRLRVSMISKGTTTDLCVSMARWYIDPLSETLNLWNPNDTNLLLKLDLHPFQSLISQEKLQEYLEATLVHVVCDFGVDINRIKNSKHLEATLQFVCGLGPRKCMDLIRFLKLGSIGTRAHLRMGHANINGLGELVYYNCASFIRISAAEAMDILDTTRLHPIECYKDAEYMCTNSLDGTLNGEEAIQEVFSTPYRLDDLDLEEYSKVLFKNRNRPRMLPFLLFLKKELTHPYSDYRVDLQDLTENEEFCCVLQIDRQLMRRGSHVMCRIDEANDHTIKACILPLELRAHVSDYKSLRDDVYRISKEQNRTIQLRGTCISARVVNVDYKPSIEAGRVTFKVEVTLTGQQRRYLLMDLFTDIKRSLSLSEEHLSPLVHFDVNYSKKPMLNEYTEKHRIHYRRVIRHPSYRMWPLNKIIAFLKQPEIPIGECCICPMSEWDRLNLVIKTCSDPFNCATFVIHEKNQRVPGELGKELVLLNQTYNSIDQIISQFCETLKLNLEEIYMHPKLKRSTDVNKAERDLIQESAMRPDGIAWAILPPSPSSAKGSQTRYNPLRFTLLVIPPGLEMSQGTRSLQDSIYVDHKCFKLWTHHEKSLSSLIKWWKQVGYWNRNRHRELYNQEKIAMMNMGQNDNRRQQ